MLGSYILKPLFSFAGTGVNPDLTPDAIAGDSDDERAQWILQERVAYAPALIAPDGTGVKAEMRMMFLKPDDAAGLHAGDQHGAAVAREDPRRGPQQRVSSGSAAPSVSGGHRGHSPFSPKPKQGKVLSF